MMLSRDEGIIYKSQSLIFRNQDIGKSENPALADL
jgi:hypothetical protein